MSIETFTDDLSLLIKTLPENLQQALNSLPREELLEVVMDLGRPPQARLPQHSLNLSETPVNRADLDQVISTVGQFGADNRAGIEGTLHRISAIRNRHGSIIGLTLRVGRAIFGTIDLIRDLIEANRSVLLLGRPGVGKTTKLREIARVLADEFDKRVIVIDTSNEIAGDGDIPHRAIGSARRMQVTHPDEQHAVMIEAVENHMPEVIIVDEIGTAAEAMAARTIAERG
ncbi:MAG: AAA family ATPase, partial [Gammaproteobacteria bacterium]